MNWIWRRREIKSEEFALLEKKLSSLQLRFTDLELELALILKKLKFKYKITKRDLKEDDDKGEPEDIYNGMLLKE